MNEGELRALIVENLSNEMNEKFKTFKVVLEPMNIGGVKVDEKPVEVKARNPREAIIKAADAKGLKKGDWVATKTKSIKVIKEDVEVSEAKAKPAGLSKKETLKVAQKFADALTKLDGKKYTVSSDYEEDSFDLDVDGIEYDGGSYNINDDGSVVNMATWNRKTKVSPTYGNMDDDIKTIIKTIKNLKESVVTEGEVTEGSDVWKRFDAMQKLQEEIMDIEYSIAQVNQRIKDAHSDMEQEAEPEGGPISDKYGNEIEKEEKTRANLRKSFNKLMAKLEKLEQE